MMELNSSYIDILIGAGLRGGGPHGAPGDHRLDGQRGGLGGGQEGGRGWRAHGGRRGARKSPTQ